MGFPIENPDIVCEMEFDYVIIAIENEITANSVRVYLINQGIPDEKIIWMY